MKLYEVNLVIDSPSKPSFTVALTARSKPAAIQAARQRLVAERPDLARKSLRNWIVRELGDSA